MSQTLYIVQLPSEVIGLIIHHLPRDGTYTYSLWSCCLLSREWYRGAIDALYHSPRLNNRNFDKFARTVCPPVNSHIRQVGLETLVHHLDMGPLAYESSRSLTARMLRRTRINLETFVAPAVSFSVACLAPLSKCANLKVLDLSRDAHLSLEQLLHSICELPVEVLNLPRSAMKHRSRLHPIQDGAKWPLKLRKLGINEWLPPDLPYWQELFASWPSTLIALSLEDGINWNAFNLLYRSGFQATRIEHLSLSSRVQAGILSVNAVTGVFPHLATLAIPAPDQSWELGSWLNGEEQSITESQLETLTLRKVAGLVRVSPFVTTEMLTSWIITNPRLTKINVPDEYLKVEDSSESQLEFINSMMAARIGNDEDSGVYLT